MRNFFSRFKPAEKAVGKPIASGGQPRLRGRDGKLILLPRQGVFWVGRGYESEVQIDDDCVSRRHAQGKWESGKLLIYDQSSNGTLLNGKPMLPGVWVHTPVGSTLTFGADGQPWTLEVRADPTRFSKDRAPGFVRRDGKLLPWPEDSATVHLGQSGTNLLVSVAPIESHVNLYWKDRVLWAQNRSHYASRLNGEQLPWGQWIPVGAGDRLEFGKPVVDVKVVELGGAEVVHEAIERLPDGRNVRVQRLANQRFSVHALEDGVKAVELYELPAFKPTERAREGDRVLVLTGERQFACTYAAEGFGHSMVCAEEHYRAMLEALDYHLRETVAWQAQHKNERSSHVHHFRDQWIKKLQLTPRLLAQPEEAARILLEGRAPLGLDGESLWPPDIEGEAVRQHMQRWAAKTLRDERTFAEAGVLELKMQIWLAKKRGELCLFQSQKDGSLWSDKLAVALAKRGNVRATRIGEGEAALAWRQAAGQYELPAPRPKVTVLRSDEPRQEWIFQGGPEALELLA